MKPFYSDYVQHCMRFYARHPQPTFCNKTDELNWNACDKAIKKFTDDEKEILLSVYYPRNFLSENVKLVSANRPIEQGDIWKLVTTLEQRIAKNRNLI